MKTKKMLSMVVTVFILLQMCGVIAGATVLFESDGSDNTTAVWTGSMTARMAVVDSQDSLRGNCFASYSTLDSKSYKTFNAPVTSGNLTISYEVKMNSESDGYVWLGIADSASVTNGDSGGLKMFGFNNGKMGYSNTYGYSTASWSRFYTANTWYKVDIDIDLTNNKVDYYIDGTLASTIENAFSNQSVYGIFLRMKCLQDGVPNSYVDNIKVTTGKDLVNANITSKNGYVDVAFDKTVSGINMVNINNIIITPMINGNIPTITNVLKMSSDFMRIYYEGGSAGSEYKISAVNGLLLKDIYQNSINESQLIFNTPVAPSTHYYIQDDFNSYDQTHSQTAPTGWSATYASVMSSVTDSSGTGYAVNIARNAAGSRTNDLYQTLSDTPTTGDIYLEFKYYLNKIGEDQPFFRVTAEIGGKATIPFEAQPPYAYAYTRGTSATSSSTTLSSTGVENGKWYSVKIIYHMDTMKYDVEMKDDTNTQLFSTTGIMIATDAGGLTSKDITKMTFTLRAASTSTTYAGTVFFDDVMMSSLVAPPPSVQNVRMNYYDGAEIFPSATVASEIDKIKIKFSSNMDATSLNSAVTLKSNGVNVPFEALYDNVSDIYTLNLQQYLMQNTSYTLTIQRNACDGTGLTMNDDFVYNFTTTNGKFEIAPLELLDAQGNQVSLANINENDVITLKTVVINTVGEPFDICLSYGVYNGIYMKDMNFCAESIPGTMTKYEKNLYITVQDVSNISNIKGFLWNNMTDIKPYCEFINIGE